MTGWQRMRYIRDLELPAHHKYVLFMLNVLANRQGVCFPGLKFLSKCTGLSQATLKRVLDKLDTDGLIKRTKRYKRSNLYLLTLESYELTQSSLRAQAELTEVAYRSRNAKTKPMPSENPSLCIICEKRPPAPPSLRCAQCRLKCVRCKKGRDGPGLCEKCESKEASYKRAVAGNVIKFEDRRR